MGVVLNADILYIILINGIVMAEKICTRDELKKLGRFLKGYESDEKESPEKGMLFYHSDADGVCSAALFLRFFEDFRYSPRKGPAMAKDFVDMVLDKRPRLLVFLDMPVDQERKTLNMFLKEIPKLRIIIIDHHITEKNIGSDRVVHINPRFLKSDAYIPAACAVYRILEEMGKDVRPMVWIAAMGVIGDYGWPDCHELIEECKEGYPSLLRGNPRESVLGKGAEMIASATTIKGLPGIGECLKVLLVAKGYEDFESSENLQAWKREFDEEFGVVVSDFEEKKEVFEKEGLIVYEVKSRLSLTSVLSTHLGSRFPENVIAIKKADGERWKVSLRNQSGRVNLGVAVKEAVKGIGSGGGHEKAAAALVSDWEKFLKRLRKEISSASS